VRKVESECKRRKRETEREGRESMWKRISFIFLHRIIILNWKAENGFSNQHVIILTQMMTTLERQFLVIKSFEMSTT
jgi:hypothetical protein